MESSIGLHEEIFDSNKSFLNKVKDESVSEGFFKYCFAPDDPCVGPYIADNTVNFDDIDKRLYQNNLFQQPPPKNFKVDVISEEHRN